MRLCGCLKKCFRKSATNGLHFFVRYDNMYCSDAQMSLLEKQVGIWKKVSYKVKLKA